MKRVTQAGLVVLTAATFAFAASANADPGEHGRMGQGATGQAHAQGQHAGMQARMAQRMAQHQGGAAGGCATGQQAAAQEEHKH